jgi:hypothetical protein
MNHSNGRCRFEARTFIPDSDAQLIIVLFKRDSGVTGAGMFPRIHEQLTDRLKQKHYLILG